MEEIFKDIAGFEGSHQISNLGRVKSLERFVSYKGAAVKINEKILKNNLHRDGYDKIGLAKENKQYSKLIHRLVAFAFIPNPENKREVNHINGIKHDNRIENLEWCTRSENIQHSFDTGLQSTKGDKHPGRKICLLDAQNIRKELALGVSVKELLKKYKIRQTSIYNIKLFKSWNYPANGRTA